MITSFYWQLTDGWMVFSFIHSIALAKVNWTIGNLHVYIRMIYHIYFCSRSSAVGKALHHESIKGSVNRVLELFEENQPTPPQIVCKDWHFFFNWILLREVIIPIDYYYEFRKFLFLISGLYLVNVYCQVLLYENTMYMYALNFYQWTFTLCHCKLNIVNKF